MVECVVRRIVVWGALLARQGSMYVVMTYSMSAGTTAQSAPCSRSFSTRMSDEVMTYGVGVTPIAMVCMNYTIINVVKLAVKAARTQPRRRHRISNSLLPSCEYTLMGDKS
jgi:hypothetical protein